MIDFHSNLIAPIPSINALISHAVIEPSQNSVLSLHAIHWIGIHTLCDWCETVKNHRKKEKLPKKVSIIRKKEYFL